MKGNVEWLWLLDLTLRLESERPTDDHGQEGELFFERTNLAPRFISLSYPFPFF